MGREKEREKRGSGRSGRPKQPGLKHKFDFFIMLNSWLCSLSANGEFFLSKTTWMGFLVLKTLT
jgi:hypothetical protein